MKAKLMLQSLLIALLFGITHAQNETGTSVYTPEKGTLERSEILEALRSSVYDIHHTKVIFVVNYLRIYNGWAWIHTLPRQADGTDQYEDILALLHKEEEWKILEIPCAEEDNPECITSENYFRGLKQRFPDLPECILPDYD